MTAIGYISDTEEIIKSSWSLFQQDGVAAYKLSERSLLPPASLAMDLPQGQTQVSNVHQMKRFHRLPAKSDEDSAAECISDTEHWLYHFDNPNDSEDNWKADVESYIEQDNGI